MTPLAEKTCKPCEGGVAPLTQSRAKDLIAQIHTGWRLDSDGKSIGRTFEFPVFSRTIAFVNAVAWIATVEGHHPDLEVSYGRCVVRYTTHAIGGLSD
ncbi:MAG: 4a-hydroxytetrahydrobiopterin dehydratase, partial [Pseudomonadota bacterium]